MQQQQNEEEDQDALEAEIARLEAELGLEQRVELGQFLSDNHGMLSTTSNLSYDEVTIDTAEFTQHVQNGQHEEEEEEEEVVVEDHLLLSSSQSSLVSSVSAKLNSSVNGQQQQQQQAKKVIQPQSSLRSRGGAKKRYPSSSSIGSNISTPNASFRLVGGQSRQPSIREEEVPADDDLKQKTSAVVVAEEDEAARIQREIDEMEAALAAPSRRTRKVRKVRKKPSARSSEEALQRQISEMEAELGVDTTTDSTKSLPFLAQLKNQTTKSVDDESAMETIGTKPERKEPQHSFRTNDVEQTTIERPPNPFASAGLLSAISQAAHDRDDRLAKGETRVTEVAAAPETTAPQLSTSLAEMISARATARDQRLANGGEKRMTKPKEELKQVFSNVVTEAASMGRLTRLDEHVVVAIAVEKTPEQEWKSNGLLAIQWRSNHMAVIHEAARVGNEVKMPEKVVSGDNGSVDDDALMDAFATKPMSERKRQLLEASSTIGEGQAKVDKLILYRKEEKPAEHLLVKPMTAYTTIEEIRLPKEAPPRVDPVQNAAKLNKYKREMLESGRPMVDISNLVAEKAWERRARLDRPGAMPKMVEKCDCPYCENASPYQTYAYRELFKKRHEIAAQKEAERLEMERKREERRRQREEKRRLERELAEAEAAIAAAKANEEQPEQIEQAPKIPETPVPTPEATPCCACTIM